MQTEKRLEEMLEIVESRLQDPVSGRMEVVKRKNKAEFYKCTGPGPDSVRTRTYLKHADIEEARRLAQAAYDKKALKIISGQIKAADAFLKRWDEDKLKTLYRRMAPERRQLIEPVEVDDETYAAQWLNKVYEPGRFDPDYPEIYTNNGERVRSKSEKIIADELLRRNIPYLYEYPFIIEGRKVRPDFYMLNVRTRKAFIMELLGMMDDPDYAKNNVRKLNSYAREGFIPGKNLILLYETQNQPVDMTVFRILMDTYLK